MNTNSFVIRVIAVVTAIVILTLSFPAYAENVNGINFDNQPYNGVNTNVPMYISTSNNVRYADFYCSNAYLFYWANSNEGSSLRSLHAISKNFQTIVLTRIDTQTTVTLNVNEIYGDYYYSSNNDGSSDLNHIGIQPSIPFYVTDTLVEAIEEIIDTITPDDPPEPTPTPTPGPYGTLTTVNLPAGNVAYIDISNISLWDGFTANAVMPENSSLIGPPWWNSNQRFGFSSSLPSQGMPVTGLTNIDWNKSSNGGVFGITRQASYSPVGPFQSSKYLVVYNPLYYGGTANGPYEWIDNPTISISVRANNVVVYPLLSSVGPGSSPGSSQVDTTVNGTPDDGTIDSATGEITWTKDGEISAGPQTGGANEPGAKNTINDWLENIATQISNFFSGAIGAVNTLIVAVRNFVDILKGLYIWLPGPVYNIIQSAIMLAITIGVVKVFI